MYRIEKGKVWPQGFYLLVTSFSVNGLWQKVYIFLLAFFFFFLNCCFFKDDPDYVPVGCFKDKVSARALPEMLANFRIESAKWPEELNWNDLEGTVVKKCAAKVRFQRCLFTI